MSAIDWSPQQADLLFMSNREGNGEIYLLRPGDDEWINLSRNPGGDNWAEWSPDGSRIAFQSGRDGKLDIWVMDADGSNQRRLTDHPDHDYLPAWTPDGARIAFTSWRAEPVESGSEDSDTDELDKESREAGEPAGKMPPKQAEEERSPHIYIMNADGSGQRRLLKEPLGTSAGANFSPDGSLIVFSRKMGERPSDLFLADAEGTILRRLTDEERSNSASRFSPDGSLIAFYSDDGDTSRIEVIRPDGSGRRVIVGEGKNWYPTWSPDGRWLLFTAAPDPDNLDDLNLYMVPLDASSLPQPIVQSPGRQAEGRWRPWPR
ncbi:MAG TPA: hypothetical protein VLV83_21880 [Acidobacteriota bacterium]|nr:hypothetical protein [Acidobacteriota bacterium]